MNPILYFYDKQSKLYEYDHQISKKYFFPYEINDVVKEQFILSNKKRYILYANHLLKGIYLSNCEENQTKDGINFESCGKRILLIPVGMNIYFLAYCDASEILLSSLLYTFIVSHQCVIDVSKYFFYFKENCVILPLYKKK